MSAIFKLSRQVEFNHCDAAGIVFYPRYFEMIAAVQERFFADALGASWAEMTPAGLGTPMGEITVRFSNPSRLGDMLDFALVVPRIGTASAGLDITCHSGGELRFSCNATVVYAAFDTGRSLPWPADLRTKLIEFLPEDRKKTA